jgi:hypothetical protein
VEVAKKVKNAVGNNEYNPQLKTIACPEGRFSWSQLDKKDRENRPHGFLSRQFNKKIVN